MRAIVILVGLLFGITASAAAPKNALPEVTSANKATYEKWSQQIAVQIADIRKLLAQPNLSPKLRAFYQGEIKRLDQEHAQILTCLLQHRVKQRGKQLADLKRSIQNKPKTTPVPAKPSVLPSRTARSSPRPRRGSAPPGPPIIPPVIPPPPRQYSNKSYVEPVFVRRAKKDTQVDAFGNPLWH